MILYTKSNTGVEVFIEVTKVKHFPDNKIICYDTLMKGDERIDLNAMEIVTLNSVDIHRKDKHGNSSKAEIPFRTR